MDKINTDVSFYRYPIEPHSVFNNSLKSSHHADACTQLRTSYFLVLALMSMLMSHASLIIFVLSFVYTCILILISLVWTRLTFFILARLKKVKKRNSPLFIIRFVPSLAYMLVLTLILIFHVRLLSLFPTLTSLHWCLLSLCELKYYTVVLLQNRHLKEGPLTKIIAYFSTTHAWPSKILSQNQYRIVLHEMLFY